MNFSPRDMTGGAGNLSHNPLLLDAKLGQRLQAAQDGPERGPPQIRKLSENGMRYSATFFFFFLSLV